MTVQLHLAVLVTLYAWWALEVGLLVRDWARGKGSTARDQGTLSLNIVAWIVALTASRLIDIRLGTRSPFQLGHWHQAAGLAVMLVGLAIRVWAIVMLGPSFRATVEVDAGQLVVDRGPYRWVRHPSYSGMLLIAAGLGLAMGNWLSLTVLVLLPLATLLRRIFVEEATLTEVIGQPYVAYRARTKRLVPGLW